MAGLPGGIGAGASFAGTTTVALTALSAHSVVCTLVITNYTRWQMKSPLGFTHSGYLQSTPSVVMPGEREVIVSHKGNWTACGIFATVSWLVDDKERAFAMWSCPYNFNHFSNEFAVGIIGPNDHDNAEKLTNELYNLQIEKWNKWRFTAKPDGVQAIDRHAYYSETREITGTGDLVFVTGTMGSSHKTEALFSVFPRRYEDLAPAVQRNISEEDYKTPSIIKK